MFLQEITPQGVAWGAMEAGWMIVETANVNTEDGIEKYQPVKLKQ